MAPKLSGNIHLKSISKMFNPNSRVLANPTHDGVDASLDLSDELGMSEKSFLEAGFNFSDESPGGHPLSNISKTANTAVASAETSSLNQLYAAYAHGIFSFPLVYFYFRTISALKTLIQIIFFIRIGYALVS